MKKIQNWIILFLISIIIIAVILRLIKLYEFAIWGSDSGEHYYLLDRIISSGYIQVDYNGWGFAYPYFPGMHLFLSSFVNCAGISTYQALILIIPTTAAFSVLLIFCITYQIFKDARVGLVAAGFLAVLLPHIYASSHPMPGSLGGLLLLTCLFLLLKTYESLKFLLLLIISTMALILTHHLSTYFLIISVVSIILMREILQYPKDRNRTCLDMGYLTFLISVSMGFWLFYAVPFRERILLRGLQIPYWTLPALAYLAIGLLILLIYFRRKFAWEFKPRFFKAKKLIFQVLLFQILGIVIIGISTITVVPGTDMQTGLLALPLFLPIIIFMSFLAAAPAFSVHYKDGMFILAWMLAILASIIFSFITKSRELLLYRHLQYIFEPIVILAGLGIVKLFDLLVSRQGTEVVVKNEKHQQIKISKNLGINNTGSPITYSTPWRIRLAATSLIIILFVLCGSYSYPPVEVVSGFEEGTTTEEFDTCFWARENLEEGSTLASDHRMSSMIFGFAGINCSWEYAPKTLHGESISDIQDELELVNLPAGKKSIDYVLITSTIKRGVALEQWENAQPMTENAINKFNSESFVKLFDNGEAQIYLVNI